MAQDGFVTRDGVEGVIYKTQIYNGPNVPPTETGEEKFVPLTQVYGVFGGQFKETPEGLVTSFVEGYKGRPTEHEWTPCSVVGLKVGDKLLSVNGVAMKTLAEWQAYRDTKHCGEKMELEVMRGSERLVLGAWLA
jgi:predicted metalloprotease with PDZ domain